MTNRKAFTLIELLVVISIIALLIAILLPALKSARETALSAVCKSKEKQYGIVNQIWLNDHDQRLLYFVANGNLWSTKIADTYPDAINKPESYDQLADCLLIGPKDSQPIRAGGNKDYAFYTVELGGSYQLNQDLNFNPNYEGVHNDPAHGGTDEQPWLGKSAIKIAAPSEHLLLMENVGHRTKTRNTLSGQYVGYRFSRSNFSGGSASASTFPPDPTRHPGGADNYLFFDGHVEAHKARDMKLSWVRYDHNEPLNAGKF